MVITKILFIILLILCAGFFSSSETAYLSLSKLKVRSMLEQKKNGARVVEKLKSNMDRLLTTVLIGTNLVNSFTSAFITAMAIGIFGQKSVKIVPFLVAFILTTFGQIIPKTAAGLYPEKFSLLWAVPLKILEIVLFPVVCVFEGLSKIVVFAVELIIKPKNSIITEEELKTLIDIGENEGTIEKDESYMLNKLIKFNDLDASDIMKHRSRVSMISESATMAEVTQEFLSSGFSTLTVYKENRENVTGVINYKKILFDSDSKINTNCGEGFAGRIMDEVIFVPGTLSVLELLNSFRKSEHKFAVVLNEQGQTSGIVTMEDIMRVVFGRMTDENLYEDLPPEDKITLVSVNTFLVPGDMSLEDVNHILGTKLESENMNTLGGWLLEKLGYLPAAGTVYIHGHSIFTAEEVQHRRISQIRIKV